MTDRQTADEELRRAFQSLGGAREESSPADLDRVWRAVTGELPPSERRALVDRMAGDPALAESWRVARELYRQAQPSMPAAATSVRFWSWSRLAAAAVLLVAAGAGLIVQLSRPAIEDTYRDPAASVVTSLVPSDAVLPRDAFRLRWTPGPEGSRYQVRVTTEDLQVLAAVSDLTTPELVVSRERLSAVAPGARVFWQVDVTPPDGNTIPSQTFVVRLP